jgi:hypothetical protein
MEYYAPKARTEVEEVEATVWPLVQGRYSDSTVKWANPVQHPTTGKWGVILPEDWRDLGVDLPEVDIVTHNEMEAAGWFPVEEI